MPKYELPKLYSFREIQKTTFAPFALYDVCAAEMIILIKINKGGDLSACAFTPYQSMGLTKRRNTV